MSNRAIILAFWCCLAAGLLFRTALAASDTPLSGDALYRYHPLAVSIASGAGFVTPDGTPNTFEQPGYPYLLAGVYLLFGPSPKAGALFNLLLELLSVALVWPLAGALGLGEKGKGLALALALASPFLAIEARLLCTEPLATVCAEVFLLCLVLAAGRGRLPWWALSGACAGLCLLVRADTLPLVCLAYAVAVALSRRAAALLAVPALLLVMSPWLARNYAAAGSLRPLGGVAEQANYPYARWLDTQLVDPLDLPKLWWGQQALYREEKYRAMAEGERKERPLRALVLVPAGRALMTWARLPWNYGNRYVTGLNLLAWLLVVPAAVAGIVLSLRRREWVWLLPLAVIVGRTALPFVSAVGAESRLLVEALPACFLFAAYGAAGGAKAEESVAPS